jgi:hypothetical protein
MNPGRALILTMISVLILPWMGLSQNSQTAIGKSEVIQDQRVDVLLNKHIRINELNKTIEGYRIQIFSDSGNNSKANAQSLRDEFMSKYPSLGVYLTFKSPNYKVRIGDFRTRLDAQRLLNDISVDFPNAFIVTDQINLPNSD